MSEDVEGSWKVRDIFFNREGKFCLPCTTYKGFQYVYSYFNGHPVKQDTIANNSVNTNNNPNINIGFPNNNDLIPGSRTYVKEDPPDVNQLGASSWDLLHSIAAKYPNEPTSVQKNEMTEFLTIFSHIYPCHWCAHDFEKYIREHSPKVESKEQLSLWMCQAHNHVNKKLNKPQFNCNFWKQRWLDGWDEPTN